MRTAIVSYYAPPQRAIASHRVLRLTRAMLALGHEVHWVTARASALPDPDASLEALIPEEVTVHGLDGQALVTKPVAEGFVEKVLRTLAFELPRRLAIPDGFFSWMFKLRRRLPGILRAHDIEAVVLCCSPHNQILVLPGLRRRMPGLRIFVDYRDLLSGNPWNRRGREGRERRLIKLERRMLRHADLLLVNTEAGRRQFLAVVGEIQGLKVEVMRNAADYELAELIKAGSPAVDLGPGVHLGFFGTLFERRRLLPVLRALEGLDPSLLARLTVHVYCDPLDSARYLREDCAAVGPEVSRRVQRHDYLPYVEALRAMQAMDALILVNGPEESDAIFVPGKLYDYLMARRPVLFVGHQGDAQEIVAKVCGPEWCLAHDDRPGLERRVQALLGNRPGETLAEAEYAPARAFQPLLSQLVG